MVGQWGCLWITMIKSLAMSKQDFAKLICGYDPLNELDAKYLLERKLKGLIQEYKQLKQNPDTPKTILRKLNREIEKTRSAYTEFILIR